MKKLFVHAKSDLDVLSAVKKVKTDKKLGLVTTIQHLHKLKEVQKLVPNSVLGGQVLGCDVSVAEKISSKVDAFLFIGSGKFHPLEIAHVTGKDVFCADPYCEGVRIINKKDVEKWQKKIQGAYLKYLHSDKVGIIVSTKHGQANMKAAEEFKKSSDKDCFIFVFDTIDFEGLENFPDIDVWVNTACIRIGYDDTVRTQKPIINLDDLKKLIKK